MSSETHTGQVKWFNTKTGFGFITVMSDGEYKTKDIFVHHSDLTVTDEQYRYLVMGEYVQFSLMETDDEHKVKATGVSGVMGGRLMCQVRNENQKSSGDKRGARRGNRRQREETVAEE